jgi:hypothetical protein
VRAETRDLIAVTRGGAGSLDADVEPAEEGSQVASPERQVALVPRRRPPSNDPAGPQTRGLARSMHTPIVDDPLSPRSKQRAALLRVAMRLAVVNINRTAHRW